MLPDAVQLADPSHLVKFANARLDECRRRVQKETLGMHLPIVVAIGMSLPDLALPIAVKLLIALSASTAILLLAYQLLVRRTAIGA